jgi:hypothetical protein
MFRDLFLQGGLGGFDVTSLFSSEQKGKYTWLAGVLLNVRHMPSIASYVEMKRQLVIFVDTEIIPALINQVQEGHSQGVKEIIGYMAKQDRQDYVYSVEQLIKRLIDPGEDYPVEDKPVLKIQDFKDIYKLIASTDALPKEYTN